MTSEQLASDRDPDRSRRTSRAPWLRRPLAVVGVLGVLAAGAALGPDLVSSGRSQEQPSRPAPPRSGSPPAPSAAAHAAALSWPTRGDLAADRTFAAAALARVRTERRQTQHLIYAGTLPDGSRLALVATDRAGPQETARATADLKAVLARPGSDIRSGSVRPAGALTDLPLTGWAGTATDGHVYAVVTGPAGSLHAQVSALVSYAVDGTAVRRWRVVRGAGSAIVDLGRRTDPSVFARPDPPDAATVPIELPVVDRAAEGELPGVLVAGLADPAYAGPSRPVLVRGLLDACGPLLELSTADVRVIWSGSLDQVRRVALVRVRRPDGPAFQVLLGGESASDLLSLGPLHVPPAAADDLPWFLDTGDPALPMVVINPSGRGYATVGTPGEPMRRIDFGADGLGRLGVGGPTTPHFFGDVVDVRRPDGSLVVRAKVTTLSSQDPLALDL